MRVLSVRMKKPMIGVLAVGSVALVTSVSVTAVRRSRLLADFAIALERRHLDSAARAVGQPSAADAQLQRTDSAIPLRVLTFNVWALPVALPGMDRRARLPKIPEGVLEHGPTVVAFQEAFDVDFRRFAIEYFGEGYRVGAEALCQERAMLLRRDCSGGLLTLSRYPVTSELTYRHPKQEDMKLDERNSTKGFLITTLSTPLGPVHVINIHLYAGRNAHDEEVRLAQVRHLRSVIEERGLLDRPIVLAGDLNSVHPSVAANDERFGESVAYSFLTDTIGLVETAPTVGTGDYTYQPSRNGYADLWYNGAEGEQKLDYVLYRTPPGFEMRVVWQGVVLDADPPLSDHYAFFVELALGKRR